MSAALSKRPIDILLVEDNPEDVFLMRRALERSRIRKRLHVVEDGEDALRFLHREAPHAEAPRPRLVLLDLFLPGMSGLEVLHRMNEDPALRSIPVIVVTVAEDLPTLLNAYDARARAYVGKPTTSEGYDRLFERIEAFWFETARLPAD
ncbi:MAG: response regulator [Rhodothermales bacterium]|nr:response regulator [Rhodothermales bacterium]